LTPRSLLGALDLALERQRRIADHALHQSLLHARYMPPAASTFRDHRSIASCMSS